MDRTQRSGAGIAASPEQLDLVITPVGELDMTMAPALHLAIRNAIASHPRRVVLDVGSLTFIDSSGCNVLATAWREARAAGVRIALRGEMARTVKRVLAITMLSPIFEAA